jgi:hypothetical protein
MKYLKMLGLAAVAAMALMAVVGATTASATQLDKVTASGNVPLVVGDEIKATLEPGTSINLTDTAGNPIDTCKESTVSGKVTNAGSSTTTVVGKIETLDWGMCTQNPTQTLTLGELEIHTIAGTDNGTVTGKNSVVTISVFGVSCRYGTGGGTDIGTLTGTTSASSHATMDINANLNEQEPKQFLCPDTGKWMGSYIVTTPTGLFSTP